MLYQRFEQQSLKAAAEAERQRFALESYPLVL
jgi:hypothetical protein